MYTYLYTHIPIYAHMYIHVYTYMNIWIYTHILYMHGILLSHKAKGNYVICYKPNVTGDHHTE
jgi:hypothetical protein